MTYLPLVGAVHTSDFSDGELSALPELPADDPVRLDVRLQATTVPLLLVRRTCATRVTVLANGAVDLARSRGAAVFQRSSWWQEIDSHQIYVCDPATVGPNAVNIGWLQTPPPEWIPRELTPVIKRLSAALGVRRAADRAYFGSSAGGFIALSLLRGDHGARGIVNNAQFDWTRWYPAEVKAVLERSYAGAYAANVRDSVPDRANVLHYLIRSQREFDLDYWVNTASSMDNDIQLPIFDEYRRRYPGLTGRWRGHTYEDPTAGHNPLDKEATLGLLNTR